MSSTSGSRFGTLALTSSLTIVKADNVIAVTIQVVTGPIVITGDWDFQNSKAGTGSLQSQNISLAAGTNLTLSGSLGAPIDNLTINATGGSVNLLFQP